MILEFQNPVAEKWARNYMEENAFLLSQKQLMRSVKARFGEDSVIRRQLTQEEWVKHYEYYLKLNIDAEAPKLILNDLQQRLQYWKKRCKRSDKNES